jgi:uncharacterized protein (DUF58 family)
VSGVRRPGSASVTDVAKRAVVLRRLELEVLRKLDGIASGDHETTGIGPGSERAGAREYVPGDDARLIDWNLTARSASTYVRNTVAEREVDTWIIPDCSASMHFGTARMEKFDVVLGAAAAIGMLTVRGHNRLGLLIAGTQGGAVHPPRTGQVWLMAVLRAIYDTPRQEGSPVDGQDIAGAMRRLLVAQQRRSLIVVVSDFLGSDRWVQPMRALAVRHQVIAVHVTDPRELELPAVGMLAVVDTETGRQRYVQASASLVARYAAAAEKRHGDISRAIASTGGEYLHLSTARDWLTDTLLFATRRKGLGRTAQVDRLNTHKTPYLNSGISR